MKWIIQLKSLLDASRQKAFNRIFILFLLPILCYFVASLFTYWYYVSLFEKEAKHNYANAVTAVSNMTRNIFYEIYQTNNLLSENSKLIEILTTDIITLQNDGNIVLECTKALGKYVQAKSIIDSVFIVKNKSDLVIGTNGVYDRESFFNYYYMYRQYPREYWDRLKIRSYEFKILSPSFVVDRVSPKEKSVVPVIQPGLGNFYTDSLLVVNLKESALSQILSEYRYTPNSFLLIMDSSGHLFSHSGENRYFPESVQKTVMTEIQARGDGTFSLLVDGRKMLVVKDSIKVPSKELICAAVVPFTDLYAKSDYIKVSTLFITLLTLIMSVILSYLFARRVYNPIKKLVSMLQQNIKPMQAPVQAINEFDFLNNGIRYILHNTETLSTSLNSFVPLICEQYLLRFLNNHEFLDESRTREVLEQNGVVFRHSHFIACVTQLVFARAFFEHFTKEEQVSIFEGTINLLRHSFTDKYQVFSITLDKSRICLIINLPGDEAIQNIQSRLKSFMDVYSNDSDFLHISTGIGLIHEGFSGMHRSYKEAIASITSISSLSDERIVIYNDEKTVKFHVYTKEDDSMVFNYLAGGMRAELEAHIRSILQKNIENRIPDTAMKDLYMQLYHTGMRVAESKSIPMEELVDRDSPDLTNYQQLAPREVVDTVSALLDRIVSRCGNPHTRIDIAAIKEYVVRHYHEDIYLEKLAATFHTTPSYLSRILKNGLGVPFYTYLSNIRIGKAREMLVHTKKSISEIAEETGFNNRSTFIRMFRKLEGVTPSEYRSIHSL